MTYEIFGLILVAAACFIVGLVIAYHPRNPFPRGLVLLAVALRLVGSLARFDMIRLFYGGVADAQRYFNFGRDMADRVWSFDPLIFSHNFWFGASRWWGTAFMEKLTGVVVSLIGPTVRGSYLVFSMLAFAGLYLAALAVYRNRPGRGAVRFAAWIWLWPSLWFWPSSIGKEAVTVFAIGLTFYGYAGRNHRIRWLPYLAGLGLAFSLRPHVGAVLALATVAAHWFQSWTRLGPRRIVEMVAAAGLAVFVLASMAAKFGLDNADLEGVQEFVTYRTSQTLEGGSAIGPASGGVAALPMAYVNIWLRPFLWDVHNVMALFSAVEILFLWLFAVARRRVVILALRHWRRDRLLAFSLPLLAGYTLMIGLTFANLGIIARQRSPLFPFVFMLLTAAGAYAGNRQWQQAAQRPPTRRRRPLPGGRGTGLQPQPGHPSP